MKRYLFYAIIGLCGFCFAERSSAQSYIVINAAEKPYKTAESEGLWDKTKNVVSDTWDGTKEVTGDVWDGTKKVTGDVWDGTKNVVGDIKDGVTDDNTTETHSITDNDNNQPNDSK